MEDGVFVSYVRLCAGCHEERLHSGPKAPDCRRCQYRRLKGGVSILSFWTVEEDRILTQFHTTLSQKELAEKLGRSRGGISSRMWKLGLRTLLASHRHEAHFDPKEWVEADKGYFAGFIDGEGTITVRGPRKAAANDRRSRFRRRMSPEIILGNTNEAAITYLGRLPNREPTKKKLESGKTFFILHLTSIIDCRCLLDTLLPYLQGKREQAMIVLEAIENHRNGRPFDEGVRSRIGKFNSKGPRANQAAWSPDGASPPPPRDR